MHAWCAAAAARRDRPAPPLPAISDWWDYLLPRTILAPEAEPEVWELGDVLSWLRVALRYSRVAISRRIGLGPVFDLRLVECAATTPADRRQWDVMPAFDAESTEGRAVCCSGRAVRWNDFAGWPDEGAAYWFGERNEWREGWRTWADGRSPADTGASFPFLASPDRLLGERNERALRLAALVFRVPEGRYDPCGDIAGWLRLGYRATVALCHLAEPPLLPEPPAALTERDVDALFDPFAAWVARASAARRGASAEVRTACASGTAAGRSAPHSRAVLRLP